MYRWIAAAVVALVCASGLHAQNQGSWYLGGNISMWQDTDADLLAPVATSLEIDPGTGYGITVGYDWGTWRLGFEYGSTSVEPLPGFASSDIETFMVTTFYDQPTGVKDLEIYLGAGLGIQDISSGGFSDNGMTALFRVGVEYAMGQNLFGFGYKHQFFDGVTLGSTVYDTIDAGALEISYRILF